MSFSLNIAAPLVLATSIKLAGAFLGCCDDPAPSPPPSPPPQPVTEPNLHIDIPEICDAMKPGDKVVIKVANSRITKGSNLSVEGYELIAKVEVEGGFTTIIIEKLLAALRKFLGLNGPLGNGGVLDGNGTAESPGSTGGGSYTPATPQPRAQYRNWISAPIRTVPFDANIMNAIANDPYQTPIRFSFSVPFATADEFIEAGIDEFWVDVEDLNGQSVMPVDAELQTTPLSEWPITSRILWDPTDPPVIVVSFDLLNPDGSMVSPAQLGCDVAPRVFQFGMSVDDPKASWDFAYSASLWRTELDEAGTHHGDGGMWLGYHASSFDAVDPTNAHPEVLQITNSNGQRVSTVTRGDVIDMTVKNSLSLAEIEMSMGGRVIVDVLSTRPGPGPDETIHTFQVPLNCETGDWSVFFRNMGATPLTSPKLVPQIQPGYDYLPVTIL